MGELVYIDDMAAKKTERLQIVLSPDDLSNLDEWRRLQADLPNRSEAVRRLIGFKAPTAEWERLLEHANEIDTEALPDSRKRLLIGRAIAKGIVAMSEQTHPPYSDMAALWAILTKDYPSEAWMAVMPPALSDLFDQA
jgi:hypothetical protein